MTLEAISLDSDFKIKGSVIPSLILEITGTTTLGQKTGGSKSASYTGTWNTRPQWHALQKVARIRHSIQKPPAEASRNLATIYPQHRMQLSPGTIKRFFRVKTVPEAKGE
ncbi:MAG: hypothetical protein GY904_27760 [Planctomycetaceae bacterium]|nr:hypothetical protein [Planctomycetaceae bacterium]